MKTSQEVNIRPQLLEETKINARKKKVRIDVRKLDNSFDNKVRVDNFINLKPMLETDSDLDMQKGRNNNKRQNSEGSDANVQDIEQKSK